MRLIKGLIVVLILLAVAIGGFSFWIFRSVNAAVTHDKASQYIKIEKGTSPRETIARLVSEGIIANEFAANVYLRTFGDASKWQAGEFQFTSPISTAEAFKQLEKGEDRTIKLTIPEGFTRFDIARRIAEFGRPPTVLSKDELVKPGPVPGYLEALALMDDVTLIRDIAPEAKNLEGYMYPTTYNFARDTKPADMIKAMVEQFRKFWKPDWTAKARSIGRTPHEIITIASLIETETGVESERPIVAGIINNRLAKNIPLGIDQTNVYIAKMLGKWDGTIHKSDLEVDSPYNTRIKTGIPPGPISSVTESSIRAALEPQPNDYIFYVRNVEANDGSHWFYASAAEFEKGKAKYQEWLEKERLEKRAAENN